MRSLQQDVGSLVWSLACCLPAWNSWGHCRAQSYSTPCLQASCLESSQKNRSVHWSSCAPLTRMSPNCCWETNFCHVLSKGDIEAALTASPCSTRALEFQWCWTFCFFSSLNFASFGRAWILSNQFPVFPLRDWESLRLCQFWLGLFCQQIELT